MPPKEFLDENALVNASRNAKTNALIVSHNNALVNVHGGAEEGVRRTFCCSALKVCSLHRQLVKVNISFSYDFAVSTIN